MAWSAKQYLKFEDERSRPARDLINALPDIPPGPIIDLGCGPGNSTELLQARFPEAAISGVDLDTDMLEKARARLPDIPFEQADLAAWQAPGEPALLFSNATFQWVPDHLGQFARLLGGLPSGGVLAVQMPDNVNEPSHVAMEDTAHLADFAPFFSGKTPGRAPLPAAETYYDRLHPKSSRLDIFRTTYHHPLADADAIVEWVKSTGLRPYLDCLPDDRQEDFIAAYRKRIATDYPAMGDGRVLLRFPRLFIVATAA